MTDPAARTVRHPVLALHAEAGRLGRRMAASLGLVLLAWLSMAAPAPAADLVFGVSLPESGTRASLGRSMRQGIEMAVAEINKAGGVAGQAVRIAYEDDQGDNAGAAEGAVKRLVRQHKAAVVFGPQFEVAHLAVQKQFCDGDAVLVTAATGSAITSSGCGFVIRTRSNDEAQSRALVSYAMRYLRLYRIGVLHVDDDFGRAGAAELAKALAELGLQTVGTETHAPGSADVGAQLRRLSAAGAQLVVLWTHDNEAAAAVRQARQLGLTFRFAGNAALSQPLFIRRATAQAAEGTVSATDFVADNPQAAVKDFLKRYQDMYGGEPDLHVAAYYDAAHLAARAVALARSTEPRKVREAFSRLRQAGVLANYRCTPRGDCNHQIHIAEIEVGAPVLKSTMKF